MSLETVCFSIYSDMSSRIRLSTRVKQIACQLLDQLRLAHAGGADKDEGHGPLLGGNAHPVAADGTGHSVYRLVLTDDVGFQAVAPGP